MSRHLEDPRGISLEMYGIGELSVRNRKIKFNFYTTFLNDPRPINGA